jgi:hypothetical protein
MSDSDFDGETQEFRRELQATRGGDPMPAQPCPNLDLLMAAQTGVVFEGSEDVRRHVALCPICRQLISDLEEYEFPPVSKEEDHRIRARWQDTEERWGWFRRWRAFVLVGACAVLVIAFVLARSARQPSAPPVAASTGPLLLDKAAIKIPASAVLDFRGEAEGSKTYLTGLADALEPYRKDDYAEAARRLDRLVPQYPQAAEPPFYLGVCQLFLNRNEAAIESLLAARSRPGNTLTDDISWYLAIAFDRAGRAADARRETASLCDKAGEYHERACAAAEKLHTR